MSIAYDADNKFGSYAWPGGYVLAHLCNDGGCLCAKCANDPKNPVHTDAPDDGWRIVDSFINYEDAELMCNHCGDMIPASHGD